jgi:hypothetical protein
MMTGLSITNDNENTKPNAAKLRWESLKRAIAAWMDGPSNIISVNEIESGNHSQKIRRTVIAHTACCCAHRRSWHTSLRHYALQHCTPDRSSPHRHIRKHWN